ncbi:MAG: methyltransferase [Actinomycetota bacterium]
MSDSQYFHDSPEVPSDPVDIDVSLPDLAFRLRTDRGVFSRGALDTGTRLLLAEAPTPPATGTFLDLGCGAGPIAVALALRSPGAVVWAVDVNERARELTALNAVRAGADNVVVAAPDDVQNETRFDLIWSNPPIRIGKDALHELLVRWLSRLAPGGSALLVVQKHLGSDSLATWLEQEGWAVERLSSRAGYRLLRITAVA